MENVRSLVNGPIIPTPGAVFNAARLLYPEIGDLMVVDVGGATTDVHSVTEGSPEIREITVNPEPLAKRTVEGDLGLYVNSGTVLGRISPELIKSELGELDPRLILGRKKVIPENEEDMKLTGLLCREAVFTAVQRHAGRIRHTGAGLGRKAIIAEGRDLTSVRWIIGTGGALVRLPFGASRLRAILAIGRQDVYTEGLTPGAANLSIMGSSSDHLIVDVTDSDTPWRVGMEIPFSVDYAALMSAMASHFIEKKIANPPEDIKGFLW